MCRRFSSGSGIGRGAQQILSEMANDWTLQLFVARQPGRLASFKNVFDERGNDTHYHTHLRLLSPRTMLPKVKDSQGLSLHDLLRL